jgi:hypothetical protein
MKIKVVQKGSPKVKKNLDCPFMIDAPAVPQK